MKGSIEMDTERVLDFCPIETTLAVVGGKWKALILYHLKFGPARFNVLKRLIPAVTQRMLTQHLRDLEADGIVLRDVKAVVPPHVEYSITPLGRTLTPILEAMVEWGSRNDHLRRRNERAAAQDAAA
jgi:DNA-binding HxlR family transcriptional regulator